MKKLKKLFGKWILIVVLIAISSACGAEETVPSPATETPTPAPTNTKVPPTKTPEPTATLIPSATPNLVATQQYDAIFKQVQEYYDKGYLPSLTGKYIDVDEFHENWAQINWYRWWWFDDALDANTFVMNGHFTWKSSSSTPNASGCGLAFNIDIDEAEAHVVFLDTTSVLFLDSDGYLVGRTRGTGKVDFSLPAEADFSLIVNDELKRVYVFVDDEFVVEYSFPKSVDISGPVGFSILSGTNKGYGTSCEITDTKLWIVEP